MKRTIAFAALWTASAASAVGLGFLAVSLVDADASPVTQPLAAAGSLAAAPTPDDPIASAPAPQPPAAAPASGEHATTGGTVFASCDGGVLQVAAAPAAGWWLDDQDQHGEIEFESTTHRVEVHVACSIGGPVFRDEGVRADRNEPEDSASTSPGPASARPDGDDSDGRVGGGHGSDDPPGDDRGGDRSDDRDDD
ncbi:hypothetical protein SAMN05660642_00069 [Geodermatophilus siccatus]|uniref:Septum formation initiator n=1 Tax=Geodermatophilus siccatus TaxID=1137991 RepID=A0A1G9KLM8_9ACTN|nr:hypothetical protein [Geodermatophilus siccatus]SDL50572.1 hypothetical protein SAMN05660642_00069 [Geodermatophilus siccatus]